MIEIIPAIDLIDGRCVRLAQGDFARQKVYRADPVEAAKEFEQEAGVKRLHLVDLDGARRGRITNLKVLEAVAAATDLTIDFGGGIKTDADLRAVFGAGAAAAAVGSVAVREPKKFAAWLENYGGERILLGADVRGEKLAIDGWQTATDVGVVPFLENYFAQGARRVFVTDVARDGLLQGPAVALYRKILKVLPNLVLIASGGVSSLGDVDRLGLAGCAGVIVGKAIYEGKINLKELRERAVRAPGGAV